MPVPTGSGVQLAPLRTRRGTSMGEELRVLRAGRAILQHDPRIGVAVALYEGAGRLDARDVVLAALNRLDSIALETCETAIFDMEQRPGAGNGEVIGILDQAIARIEQDAAAV
ncbi:MAG: hypothetical protein E6H92_03705 [Chloroflexi bacterium]|nr:MAG: hypothetical protein E6H92_03705 [Chloroflexota bacterium]